MKEDSKSLAQAGMLTEIKDVDNLKILIEKVRLDQDMKLKCCDVSFYVNISGLTLPKVLIAIPCEKNQKETLGSRKPTWTGLTGPADRSDRSGSNGQLI